MIGFWTEAQIYMYMYNCIHVCSGVVEQLCAKHLLKVLTQKLVRAMLEAVISALYTELLCSEEPCEWANSSTR